MLTIEEVRKRLKNKAWNLRAIAKEIGIHENALYRLVNGETNPLYSTVKLLSDYIEKNTWSNDDDV